MPTDFCGYFVEDLIFETPSDLSNEDLKKVFDFHFFSGDRFFGTDLMVECFKGLHVKWQWL